MNDAIHLYVSSRQPTAHMRGESMCKRFHKQTLNNRQRISDRTVETALCEQALTLPDGQVVSQDTNKQFLDNHQKNTILALANHNVLFLCILFHFHVYMIENVLFEKGELAIFLQRRSIHSLLPTGLQPTGCVVKVDRICLLFRG